MRARRRARAAPRSGEGCRAGAARPRRPASARGRPGCGEHLRRPGARRYSYFIASEIGPSGTSATLTTINFCPDSTAASTASVVASASNGTSNVTSMTGLLPETTGMSAVVRVRFVPSTALLGPQFPALRAVPQVRAGAPSQLRDDEEAPRHHEHEQEKCELEADDHGQWNQVPPRARAVAPARSSDTGGRHG